MHPSYATDEELGFVRRLSPEALHAAGLGEAAMFRLYRALRVYSLGFQEVLRDMTSPLESKHTLLADAWRFFGHLWDGGARTAFKSDIVEMTYALEVGHTATPAL